MPTPTVSTTVRDWPDILIGDAYSLGLTWSDADGPLDVTGWTGQIRARRNAWSTNPDFTINLSVIDAANGVTSFGLNSAGTAALTPALYQHLTLIFDDAGSLVIEGGLYRGSLLVVKP